MRFIGGALLAAALLAPAAAQAQDREVTVEHAQSLVLRGRFPAAAGVLRERLRADASDADAWRCLAVAYEAMGRAPEAVRAYRRYLELSPGASDVELVMTRVVRLVRALGWDPGRLRTVGGQTLLG